MFTLNESCYHNEVGGEGADIFSWAHDILTKYGTKSTSCSESLLPSIKTIILLK